MIDQYLISQAIKRRDKQAKRRETTDLFENDENKGMDKKQIQEHEEATKIKTIEYVQMGLKSGREKLKTWYYSPFPPAFHCNTLYVCDVCFSFYTERQ